MKVLVVEDEMLLAAELEFMLGDAGHELTASAIDSREAREALERDRPDLALVDVHLLDGPTGVAVAREAIERHGVAVVFMTANRKRLPDDLAGACGAIMKPYTEWGMAAALRFVEACLREGSARTPPPSSLELAPAWAARWRAPAAPRRSADDAEGAAQTL